MEFVSTNQCSKEQLFLPQSLQIINCERKTRCNSFLFKEFLQKPVINRKHETKLLNVKYTSNQKSDEIKLHRQNWFRHVHLAKIQVAKCVLPHLRFENTVTSFVRSYRAAENQ